MLSRVPQAVKHRVKLRAKRAASLNLSKAMESQSGAVLLSTNLNLHRQAVSEHFKVEAYR